MIPIFVAVLGLAAAPSAAAGNFAANDPMPLACLPPKSEKTYVDCVQKRRIAVKKQKENGGAEYESDAVVQLGGAVELPEDAQLTVRFTGGVTGVVDAVWINARTDLARAKDYSRLNKTFAKLYGKSAPMDVFSGPGFKKAARSWKDAKSGRTLALIYVGKPGAETLTVRMTPTPP